jgi:hypothetical protein
VIREYNHIDHHNTTITDGKTAGQTKPAVSQDFKFSFYSYSSTYEGHSGPQTSSINGSGLGI